jgi:hypothetical protein
MSQQVRRLAKAAAKRGDKVLLAKLAKYSEQLLIFYLNQVPCIFQFQLADTPDNRRRKRVGRMSGFRQGVRNLNYVPEDKHPASQSTRRSTRYYDLGRQDWRSWQSGKIVSVTAFWSEADGAFVDTPELAGIVKGKEFTSKPASKPQLNPGRAARNAKREAAKREREQIRSKGRLKSRS